MLREPRIFLSRGRHLKIGKSKFAQTIIYLGISTAFCSCGPLPAELFKKYAYSAYSIRNSGMEPTLQIGDYVFVRKFELYFERGDVVVHKTTNEDGSERLLVHRLIGLPGDSILFRTVPLSNGKLNRTEFRINGKALQVEPVSEIPKQEDYDMLIDELSLYYETIGNRRYRIFLSQMDPQGFLHYIPDREFTLGADEYFVVGDNRSNSYDSRYFGPVFEENLQGILTEKYFSINWKDHTCQEAFTQESDEPRNPMEPCSKNPFRRWIRAKIRWKNIGQKGYEILRDRQSGDL
ncbi:signal peptidase I [Leptospira wolffii]|nr:signal peptidase I [Leptospira wolffii]TGK70368.1 signal peptidase I [Leptospira wolffii]TGK74051.1 signal peptidase I [Leptospira wolffii]TGL28910.1 signal peptidase I [Leptospira wolffii]